jgi:hypothetical protein
MRETGTRATLRLQPRRRVSHIESMDDRFHDVSATVTGPVTDSGSCKLEKPEARIVYSGTRQSYGRPDVLPLVETQL